jgi:hypothetical protein
LVEKHTDEVESKEAKKGQSIIFFQEQPPPQRPNRLGEEIEKKGEEEKGDIYCSQGFFEGRKVNSEEEIKEESKTDSYFNEDMLDDG